MQRSRRRTRMATTTTATNTSCRVLCHWEKFCARGMSRARVVTTSAAGARDEHCRSESTPPAHSATRLHSETDGPVDDKAPLRLRSQERIDQEPVCQAVG